MHTTVWRQDLPPQRFAVLLNPEGAFRTTLQVIQADALPAFERFGTIGDCAAAAEQLVEDSPEDPNYQEKRLHRRLIRGDIPGALRAADETERAALAAELPWALEIASGLGAYQADADDRPVQSRSAVVLVAVAGGRRRECRR